MSYQKKFSRGGPRNDSQNSTNKSSFNNRANRSTDQTRSDQNENSKNYKKKENYIEYRFSDSVGDNKPYIDIEIPVEKIRKVFERFREKFGENEIIKEYSTYKRKCRIFISS